MPYVRHLQDKLWEMRLKGKDGISRALYVSAAGECVVVIARLEGGANPSIKMLKRYAAATGTKLKIDLQPVS